MGKTKKEKKSHSVAYEMFGWLVYIAIIVGLTWLIITFVGQRTSVSGHSMETTLQDGDQPVSYTHLFQKDVLSVPAVLCKNHGPFTWGKSSMEAVHNSVVLEECAKMAYRTELINPGVKEAPQELIEKHYMRKHGANAYYGQ